MKQAERTNFQTCFDTSTPLGASTDQHKLKMLVGLLHKTLMKKNKKAYL